MKTIEDELSGPFTALDKALDKIEKTFTKFVHGMSPEQRDVVVGFLVSKAQATAENLQRAGQARQAFSFSASVAPKAMPDMTMRPAILHHDEVAPTPPVPQPRARAPEVPQLPPRPIGRIANDSPEDQAGEILLAPPIASPVVPNRDPGTGYINPNNEKGDLV